jgi:hypothetical protein
MESFALNHLLASPGATVLTETGIAQIPTLAPGLASRWRVQISRCEQSLRDPCRVGIRLCFF